VLCGGQESMTQAPHTVYMRPGKKMGNAILQDSMLCDGLTDAFHEVLMGVTGKSRNPRGFSCKAFCLYKKFILSTAENLAAKYGVTREEQDAYALESQEKVEKALQAGYFDKEIVPVPVRERANAAPVDVTKDEFPRPTTLEALSKLKPVFKAAKV